MSFHILQLTDSHLIADVNGKYRGFSPRQHLQKVIEHVLTHDTRPDLTILTGDNSQDGTHASYEDLKSIVALLPNGILALPGNHDDTAELIKTWHGSSFNPVRYYCWQKWHLILLDSTAPGLDDGFLAKVDLQFLEECLEKSREGHALIFIHHPPILTGAKYIDELTIINRELFLDKIKNYNQIQAVFCGHAHQEFEQGELGIKFYGTPSTFVQFMPKTTEFALDETVGLGYRWIELDENGTFTTKVVRVPKDGTE